MGRLITEERDCTIMIGEPTSRAAPLSPLRERSAPLCCCTLHVLVILFGVVISDSRFFFVEVRVTRLSSPIGIYRSI